MKTKMLIALAAVLPMSLSAAPARDLPKWPLSSTDQIELGYETMLKAALAKHAAKVALARQVAMCEAVAAGDKAKVSTLIADGGSPDTEMPFPPPEDFKHRYGQSDLGYYINREPGFTVLMIATMLGDKDMVDTLLAAGAKAWKSTHRDHTFALWLAGRAQRVDIMSSLMKINPIDDAARMRIDVNLGTQTATLWKNGVSEMVIPISSGRASKATPPGHYRVTDKYVEWSSTKYHAKMPYFLRLSCGDFGLHAGYLPGYPASHGCIRLPPEKAKELFAVVPVGTLVEIQ